jgi:hypothetical protein
MSSFRPTPALLAVLASLATLHCGSAEPGSVALTDVAPESNADVAPAEDGCRNLAAASNVQLGTTAGNLNCRFDATAAALDCQLSAGLVSSSTTSEYASVEDFIEAGRTLGKVTSLRDIESSADGDRVTSHDFDEIGRLRRSTVHGPAETLVYLYGDYDDAGRPRSALPSRATAQDFPCDAPPLRIDYSDELGTVAYHHQPVSNCGSATFSLVEQYDALGNRVRVERQSAGGSETTFATGALAGIQPVCR